jgi:acyl-coenzyme A thioesterase PaaI-like protein
MRPKLLDRVPPRWRPALLRLGFNLYPSYRATGGRVIHVSRDLKTIRVMLRRSWRTVNPAGALFGGALYAAADPMFAMLLALHLGDDVVVWDKAGQIRYRRPGRSHLYADFHVTDEELAAVRQALRERGETERSFRVELRDRHGEAHVDLEKTVYIATKAHYKAKLAQRARTRPA